MSSKPVLTYFNGRGRAEVARWIFIVAGVEFEDKRVTREEWQEIKPDSPTGQVPLLEIDGEKIGQSGAICHYLARKYGFAGANDLETALVHMIWDSANDLISKFIKVRFSKDEKEKAELAKTFQETDAPAFLNLLKKRLGDKTWLVGDKMTLADLCVSTLLSDMSGIEETGVEKLLEGDAKISALVKQVTETPSLKKWIESRPETPY